MCSKTDDLDRYRLILPFVVLVLALSLVACQGAAEPSATAVPTLPSPTSTATSTPTAPAPTATRSSTVTALPTATPTDIPLLTLRPARGTATSSVDRLPSGIIALYAASSQAADGSLEASRLYALQADGSVIELEPDVYRGATLSSSGRWLASPTGPPPATEVVITDLQAGTCFTVVATSEFSVYGLAFDPAERRLVFVEVGPPTGDPVAWAIVVVRLADGTMTRFAGRVGEESGLRPGEPLGWSPAGDELYLNTFIPYSEGHAGVWGVTLPPQAEPVLVDDLDHRPLLSGGAYLFAPRLSPDGTRLLYLARDEDYTPDNYAPIGYDLAVNQLWVLDLASEESTRLLEVTDGGALANDVAWSPQGRQVLLAEGRYADGAFGMLTLKVRDSAGNVQEVASLPVDAQGGGLRTLIWSTPDLALATLVTAHRQERLYLVHLSDGRLTPITSADLLFVVGIPTTQGPGGADLPPAVTTARRELSEQLGIPVGEIEVLSFEFVQWRNSCLGLATPGEMCAQVITPGYLILLSAQGQTYEAHSNESGSALRWKIDTK